MAWYRRGWEAGLESLELWWASSTEYVSSDGGCRLPQNYRQLTAAVVRLARDKAKIDAEPLHKLGLLIEHHALIGPAISRLPIAVSLDDLWLAAELAVAAKDALVCAGIVSKKAGRKGGGTTEQVRKLLKAGLSVDEITQRIDVTAGNVRTIRSRLNRDSG